MAHKFDPEHRERLHRRERLEWQNPRGILESFQFRKGMRVMDVGCGTGFFALPAAELVGSEGRVYAVDMQEEMLWALQERVRKTKLSNVLPILSREELIPLPNDHVDAALLVNALHELVGEYTLREAHRILRRLGFLAVVDWKKEPMERGPPLDHRVSVADASKRLEGCGFRVSAIEVGDFHYGLRAGKTASGDSLRNP